jgi:Putative zinc-finger
MVCREVEELLPEYSADALTRQQMTRVGEHLRGCERCGRERARLQAALRLVEQLGAVSPPPGLWHGVHHLIQADGAEERALPRLSPADRLRRWWSWPARAAAAAGAAAVLAAAVWFTQGVGTPIGNETAPQPSAPMTDPEMVAAVQQHALASTGQLFADRAGLESVVQLMRQQREDRPR